MLSMLKN